MTKPALITLKRMLPLSAWAAVASPVPVTVKAIRAARMADDNRMRKSPLDERWRHLTRSQPRVSKMRRIEQANKFELCFEHQSARHWRSTSAHCARRRSDRIKCGCPLLALTGHWPLHCTCPLSAVKRTWAGAMHMSAFDSKRTFCCRHYWTTVQLDLRDRESDACLEHPFTQLE